MLQYVTGDATTPIGDGPKIIAHVTNNNGGWGPAGSFVKALSRKWKAPEHYYRGIKHHTLGVMDLVWVAPDMWVANMCAQDGYREPPQKMVALNYPALGACLDALCGEALHHKASVHCPRIGCGFGGGRWETVAALLTQRLVAYGVPVTVYDL